MPSGVPERHFLWQDMAAHPAMLAHLISSHGYRIGVIGGNAKDGSMGGWAVAPRPLREVGRLWGGQQEARCVEG